MSITYIFLGITIFSILVKDNKKITIFLLIISLASAFSQNIVNLPGLGYLLLFSLICQTYFYHQQRQSILKSVFFVTLIILIARFRLHLVPGINNLLALKDTGLSSISKKFSIYLNFDKIISGLIIYLFANFSFSLSNFTIEQFKKTLILFVMTVTVILLPAYFSSYVKFDPKFPKIFWIWFLNNLLFVSVIEEIVFRGFLQNQLKMEFFPKLNSYWSIVFSSLIFGLDHYSSGIIFMILATICGLFYGYAYEKTGNLLSSIIIHFGLNLTHFLVFTYPSFANIR